MGKVTVVSMGFWGDVMPFVPIANELAGRGHDVVFAVPEGFHDQLGGEDFSPVPAGVAFSPRELAAHGDVVARARSVGCGPGGPVLDGRVRGQAHGFDSRGAHGRDGGS